MDLYIGNKNYSSWSLRAWLLMRHASIEFREIKLRLDLEDGSDFKAALAQISPSGRVPVLVHDGFGVWDTLAIAEYLAETFPEKQLWPADPKARARARSLCAEMHSGFSGLRNCFPMNIEASLPHVGPRVLRETPAALADLDRIDQMWSEQINRSGGPFLFGAFSIADAYFAPVCSRAKTYGLPLSADADRYADHILSLPSMQAWTSDARLENDFLAIDEPYRTRP